MKERIPLRSILLSLIVGLAATVTVSCSKKENPEPVVTVQAAVAGRGKIQQVITTEAVLFPKDQAALTPKITAPVKAFYVNRGSRVHQGELLAVLENRDLAAAALDNKGALEQAQGTYGIATSSSLPEEWQKAESDLKAAKQEYEAQQKIYDSRQTLFQQGALPRKEFDQAAVTVIQAKANYELAQKHLTGARSCRQERSAQVSQGAAYLGGGQVRRCGGAAFLLRYSQPHQRSGHGAPILSGRDRGSGNPAADRDGHFFGDCTRPHPAERCRCAQAGRRGNHYRAGRHSSERQSYARQPGRRSQQHHG